jgi:hypothetical protein
VVPPEPRHMTRVRFTTQHVSGRTLDGSHWSFRHADVAQTTEELSCTRSFGRDSLFFKPGRSGAPPRWSAAHFLLVSGLAEHKNPQAEE